MLHPYQSPTVLEQAQARFLPIESVLQVLMWSVPKLFLPGLKKQHFVQVFVIEQNLPLLVSPDLFLLMYWIEGFK